MGEASKIAFDTHNDQPWVAGRNFLPGSFADTNSCRVLVVDDDPMVRNHLAEILRGSQYLVEVAATGEEALRIMDTKHCHVVLTDWQMPDMDGLALCRHVREKIQESYVYVLMLTIRNTRRDVVTAFAAGADAYIVKGAAIDDLLSRVEIGRRISRGEYARATKDRDDWGLSYKDPVTGAWSLDYLIHHLPRELIRSQRHGHVLGVLVCTIEGFKRFMQRFGRKAADEQLRSFVAAAERCIRESDWLARTVGDTFVIVLPETAPPGAHRAAQKLRAIFSLHSRPTPAESMGFTVRVEVTAVDGNYDADGNVQIDALLRTLNYRTSSQPQLDDNQPNIDLLAGGSAPRDGQNSLN
jgi:diguanylate cyclase (GGDEF)-like protein